MPSFQFYAAARDRERVVAFALDSLACRVFEAYSGFDAPLRELEQAEMLEAVCPLASQQACHLAVWAPAFRAEPLRRRIELNAGAAPEHTHRFVLEGWGLVHLQFGEVAKGVLSPSRIVFNSEARARKWEPTDGIQMGEVDSWDWAAVGSVGRRLRAFVARTAVARSGAWPILPDAREREHHGIVLAAV